MNNAHEFPVDLLPDVEVGPPDAFRGCSALFEWVNGYAARFLIRGVTTQADVLAALACFPQLIVPLQKNPGPYSAELAMHASEEAMRAISEIA